MRNAPLRTRYGLVFWMPARRCQIHAVNGESFLVVVEPVLTGLKAGNYRMLAKMKVLGRVLAGRAVATAYMPAFGAAPQMKPPSATSQTFDATISAWACSRVDSTDASVRFLHNPRASSLVQSRPTADSTLASSWRGKVSAPPTVWSRIMLRVLFRTIATGVDACFGAALPTGVDR
jgi:hypothetical protein